MFRRAWLTVVVAAVSIREAYSAVPFRVNHTELRRTHPLRATNSGLDVWGRRRARAAQIQQTMPLQTTSPPLGPYWANYSLVGREVECSDAAKTCLAINRLLHEPSGICYELGDSFPCGDDGGELVLDADSFRRGQLRSRCSEPGSCNAINMAYDGKCYETSDVFEKLCEGSKEVMSHPLGGFECRIPNDTCRTVKDIHQPKPPGRCLIPDLQNADVGMFLVECSIAEEKCLKRGLLPFRGSCDVPLSNNSCSEDQWLVLDEGAAKTGRLSAKCVYSRPCGSDAKLLRADGSCHANTELFEKLCNRNFVLPLPTGDYICSHSNKQYEMLGLRNENGLCEVKVFHSTFMGASGAILVAGQNCVMDDKNICQPKVIPPNSKPDLVAEE